MQRDAAQDTVDGEAHPSLHVCKAREPLALYDRFLDTAYVFHSGIAKDHMVLPCSIVSVQKDVKLRAMMDQKAEVIEAVEITNKVRWEQGERLCICPSDLEFLGKILDPIRKALVVLNEVRMKRPIVVCLILLELGL